MEGILKYFLLRLLTYLVVKDIIYLGIVMKPVFYTAENITAVLALLKS